MPSLFCEEIEKPSSPYTSNFLSADTIVPGYRNPQSLNRYGYVSNNPLRYTDPTGHMMSDGGGGGNCDLACVHEHNQKNNKPKNKDKGKDDINYCSQYRVSTGCVPPLVGQELNDFLWTNSPDYYALSGIIPLCPLGVPICGPAFSIIIDKYGNVYVAGGAGIGLPVTVSVGGGWFLGPNNDNEIFAEDYLQEHSFNVGGGGSPLGIGPGIAVNNNHPSYIQTHNEGTKIDNIAVEGLITTTGVSAMGTYGLLLYDNGDDTPWIWQGD